MEGLKNWSEQCRLPEPGEDGADSDQQAEKDEEERGEDEES